MAILTPGGSRRYSRIWQHLDKPALGPMNAFSDIIQREEISRTNVLADLRGTPTIFVASDYGGMHTGASYQSLSFMFVNPESLLPWDRSRCFLRQRLELGSRRISYKALNDGKRRRALLPFLEAANLIPGILVNVLIDRGVETAFESKDPSELEFGAVRSLSRMESIDCGAGAESGAPGELFPGWLERARPGCVLVYG